MRVRSKRQENSITQEVRLVGSRSSVARQEIVEDIIASQPVISVITLDFEGEPLIKLGKKD